MARPMPLCSSGRTGLTHTRALSPLDRRRCLRLLKGNLESLPCFRRSKPYHSRVPQRDRSQRSAARGGFQQAVTEMGLLGTGFLSHRPLGAGRCPWLCWLTTKCHHPQRAAALGRLTAPQGSAGETPTLAMASQVVRTVEDGPHPLPAALTKRGW